MLRDERFESYSVSRSYTATPKQVNDVLRASETYADRGGFNHYTRNCTTFAKEMIVDVAKIGGAAPIFEMDDVYTHPKADAAMFGAGLFAPVFKAQIENDFAKMKEKDDLSYTDFGNKMATREDYKHYNDSVNVLSLRQDKAYSPNGAAENMLRMEGGSSGKIGSGLGVPSNNGITRPTDSINNVKTSLGTDLRNLHLALQETTQSGQLTDPNRSAGFKAVMDGLDTEKIVQAMQEIPDNNKALRQAKQSDLIRYRTIFSDIIKNCNTLLFKYYHNDRRIQDKVLAVIDTAGHGIRNMDVAYQVTSEQDDEDQEKGLQDLKVGFSKDNYQFSFTDDNNPPKHYIVTMTPSHYESYLQIYKTPDNAIKNYARYQELDQMRDRGLLRKNDQQYKDLEKYERIEDLAFDFDNSHRYMLEKAKYSQQDINYAFTLSQKEKNKK